MTETTLWTNRIIAGIVTIIAILICEKYNLRPSLCFIIAFLSIIGLSFIFAIVERIFK